MNQVEKANSFKSLHVAGKPLVLYNIWDAGSARTLAKSGAAAVATGSWAVAAAQGYSDGEKIPLPFVLQIVQRIAETVSLPLSVDFEGGYSSDPDIAADNVQQLMHAGAIGINFEDQVVGGSGLHSISDQVKRISAVRQCAERNDLPLFINARTDIFLKSDAAEHEKLLEDAMQRATAYADAGADGFFVPGLTQPSLIERICQTTKLPVNVMMKGELASISQVASLGVSRASFGPGSYATAMANLAENFKSLT